MRMNKKTIISICLCLAVFFMAVGYSILMTDLKITGGANITSTWDVRIIDISNTNSAGSAYNLEEPSFTIDTAKFKVVLVNPGDSMTYTITIKNQGTVTAILNGMDITTSGSDAIIYEVSGVKEGDTLASGETKAVTVVARYNANVIADPNESMKTLKVGLEWLQYTNQQISSTTYTVKYDPNGGQGQMVNTTCAVGSSCTLSTNEFTKDGYVFAGWAISPTGAYVYPNGTSVMNLTSSGKEVTLYATWQVAPNYLSTQILKDNTDPLTNNEVPSDGVNSTYVNNTTPGISFSAISSDTNGKGLYVTSDLTKTEDIDGDGTGEPVYYFRGAVENNFVKFGQQTVTTSGSCTYNGMEIMNGLNFTEEQCESYDVCYSELVDAIFLSTMECSGPGETLMDGKASYTPGATTMNDMYWRIIRINEDGSVRLIYNGTTVDATGEGATIGTSVFNSSDNDNAYVGYMYGATGQSGDNAYQLTHKNDNPSTIKTYIDDWYTNNTNLSSLRATHLADAGFCNDRSVAPTANTWDTNDTALGYASNMTYYGVYGRLMNTNWTVKENAQPQFACPNADNDLFTTSESSKGNNALSNPIGLITLDEVSYAGGVYGKSNNSYYLRNGFAYWTMSPSHFDGYDGLVDVWRVSDAGPLYYSNVDYSAGVRPVVNLQSIVELSDELSSGCTSQNGTASCPYIIKTN